MFGKNVRWWIIGLICLGTIINYLSRNSLGVMVPTLKTELNFTTQQYSYVVGAFQLAYTVMQPVGTRAGLAMFALLWSVASCLHALSHGWLSLACCRLELDGATLISEKEEAGQRLLAVAV